jgi:hypothetical protein
MFVFTIEFALDHYIPYEDGLQRWFKSDGVFFRSTIPFNDATMYKTEYISKEIEPCPAALLAYSS